MTIALADNVRNARADEITVARDAGAGPAEIRIYDGVRPAKGGAVTTLLGTCTYGDPSSPAAVGGVLTANAITGDASADATGTATWYREVDSNGTFVMDGDVSLSGGGGDLILNDVNIVAGLPININSSVFTEGNN